MAVALRGPLSRPFAFVSRVSLVFALAACGPKETQVSTAPAQAAEVPAPDPEAAELAARLAWLDEQLEQARIDTHVPGMAIAIVRSDEVIHAQGFGVRDLESGTPVTPETTFAIGSSTKAFSSALVGMMVDEGKLDWDDPVSKHIPEFRLQLDGGEADEATIHDLLSHRSGFARMGLLWVGGEISRDRVWSYVSQAKPVATFRDEFHYNNVTYMAGSLTAAKAAGTTWEELLQTRLLTPLGMKNTHYDYASAQADPNMSLGYTWRADLERFEREPMRNIDLIGPAGSINSTVLDMTRWLRLQLGRGTFEGQELISRGSLLKTRRSVIDVAPGVVSYGMGWMLREWQEKQVVEHGGNIDGFAASVALMPEEKLGVVLLTNASMTPLQQMGASLVWEALLTEAYLEDPNPTNEDFAPFVGKYVPEIPGFDGQLFEVMTKGGKLAVDVPGQMLFSLKPPDDDEWRYFDATDEVAVSFIKNDAGEVTTLVMHQGGMSFELLREGLTRPAEVTEAEVEDLVGYYASDKGFGGEVRIKNGRLVFDIAKQMAFDLEPPESDGEYHFRANYEMFIVFDRAKGKKTGRATGLKLYQDGKAVDFEREKAPKKVSSERLHQKRRSADRQKALEAAGIIHFEQRLEVQGAGIKGSSEMWFDASGELRQVQNFGELGNGLVVVHGEGGWSESTFEERKALEGLMLDQIRLGHPRVTFGDWRKHYEVEKVVGTESQDGRDIWVVQLRSGELPPATLRIDAKTGDIVEVRGFETAENGVRVPITTRLSDYKRVAGMRIPHRVEVSNPEAGTTVATLTKVETGLEPDPARFVDMPAK